MSYKSIFPTFDEIEKGYQVYSEEYYKGLDDNGEPRWGERLNLKIIIAHNKFSPLFDIVIVRNRKKQRVNFKFKIADKYSHYKFDYSEQGWEECIAHIKYEIIEIRKYTERILNEKE